MSPQAWKSALGFSALLYAVMFGVGYLILRLVGVIA